MTIRRTLLKTMGLFATTGSSFAGTVSAQESKKVGAAEIGLDNAIRELLSQGKLDQASKLAQKHDISYNTSKSPSGDLQTQNRNSETSSDMYVNLTYLEDDVYLATGFADIQGQVLRTRSSHRVDDIMGITWDNANWSGVRRSETNTNINADNDAVEPNYEDYTINGVVFKLDEFVANHEFTVSLQTDLISETNDDRHGVQLNYEHTYAYTSGVVDVTEILPDKINAILPSDAKSWKMQAFTSKSD